MSGLFKNEFIPENILMEFIDCYEAKDGDVLRQRNLERIVQQLDLNLYSDDMKAKLEILCERHCMVSALLSLQNPNQKKDN